MVFAVTAGRQGIMLRHTQGESSRAQGPPAPTWYIYTYKHTDLENRVLTTLHICINVVTQGI